MNKRDALAEVERLRRYLRRIENGSCLPRSLLRQEPAEWQTMYQQLQLCAARALRLPGEVRKRRGKAKGKT